MQVFQNKWFLAFMTTLCWALAASFSAGYFFYEYSDLQTKQIGVPINANVKLEYANSTVQWFNGTKVISGTTLLNLTLMIADVNYTVSSGMGILVDSINQIKNARDSFWMWWTWTPYGWIQGSVACDKYIVSDEEILCWHYGPYGIPPSN